jgi:hypothetical protein
MAPRIDFTTIDTTTIEGLPPAPSPDMSHRYLFVDTKKVVDDMADLGFTVAGFRRPRYRTEAGAFGLHEVDFRRPQDVNKADDEAPRVLFLNTYDGSRKAQLVSGVIRFICMNGMLAGTVLQNNKFIHLQDYESQLLDGIKAAGEVASKVFDRIETFKSTKLDRPTLIKMAAEARALRFSEDEDLDVQPQHLLMPRRREDAKQDLWTAWNVLQENLLKGGVPGRDKGGKVRTIRPLNQIQKSNDLNRGLWDLLEKYGAAA